VFVLSFCENSENQSKDGGNNMSSSELTKGKMAFNNTEIIVAIHDNETSSDLFLCFHLP